MKNKMKTYKIKHYFGNFLIFCLYIIMIFFFLSPIICILSISLKSPAEIFGNKNIIPDHPTLANYSYILKNTKMLVYVKNSFILVVYTVIGSLIISFLSSYGLSRFKFKNKQLVTIIILMFQMISSVVVCIPLFQFFSKLKLLNSLWALGAVYVATQIPFSTFLLKGVFDGIPREMDDSAAIDGASRFQTLYKIIIPCARSGIASAVIFLSVNAWSEFLLPFILINRDYMRPVSVGILSVQSAYHEITVQYLAAASVVGLLPSVILVIILQKFIVSAMMNGAIKG